jgi:hypothetical protein
LSGAAGAASAGTGGASGAADGLMTGAQAVASFGLLALSGGAAALMTGADAQSDAGAFTPDNGTLYAISLARASLIYQLALLHGLDAARPLVVAPAQRSAGPLVQSISGTDTVTLTTESHTFLTGDLNDWIDALAAIHGLTAPLVVTADSRRAGALLQAIDTAGDTVTVSRL